MSEIISLGITFDLDIKLSHLGSQLWLENFALGQKSLVGLTTSFIFSAERNVTDLTSICVQSAY